MTYPVFRKLDGFERFYKITDDRNFLEAYRSQGVIKYLAVKAVQFPEILRIQDMIECQFSFAPMTPEEVIEYFPE